MYISVETNFKRIKNQFHSLRKTCIMDQTYNLLNELCCNLSLYTLGHLAPNQIADVCLDEFTLPVLESHRNTQFLLQGFGTQLFVEARGWFDIKMPPDQGLYSLSGKTSYRKISWSLEAARFEFKLFQSLWNLAGTSAALLPRCLSNFRAIWPLQHPISRLRDFTRFGGKTSYRLVNRGPV